MKRIKIADFKDHLSAHLRAVERGQQLEVTDRKRPIVRLVPASPTPPAIQLVPAGRPFSEVRGRKYRPARWPVASLHILLAERAKR